MRKYFLTSLIFLTVVSAGCEHGDITETFEFSETITVVDVNVDASNVKIVPAWGPESRVDVDVLYWGIEADLDVWSEGNTLKVRLNCRPSCDGEIEIAVPPDAAVDAYADSGNIKVIGMDGDVSASTDSGNILVEDAIGDLLLEVDSGNITGLGLYSLYCEARTDSGNILMEFVEAPVVADGETDSGNVKLVVPAGTYDIQASVDSGNKTITGVVDDPGAPNRLRAKTDSGNVKIEGF